MASMLTKTQRANFLIANCLDTGTYVLSTSSLGVEHSYAYANGYATDSIHVGVFHLTHFDTVAGRIAGTFAFTGIKYKGNPSDTLRITNGVVFDFPITVLRD